MAASSRPAPQHTTPRACAHTSCCPLSSSAVSLPIEGRPLAVQPLRRHLPPRRPAPPSPSSYSSSVSPSTGASLAVQPLQLRPSMDRRLPGRPDLPLSPASCLVSLPVQRLHCRVLQNQEVIALQRPSLRSDTATPQPSPSRGPISKHVGKEVWACSSKKLENSDTLCSWFQKNPPQSIFEMHIQ